MMKRLAIIVMFLSGQVTARADTKVILPDSERFAKDDKDFLVPCTIPGDFKTPEGILFGLLILGDQTSNTKLSAPFLPKSLSSTSQGKGARPLAAYFRGARILGSTITLSFSGDAMRYLNNTAAIQQVVKGAIEATLKIHFPSVTTIFYEIDGVIVTEWDA